MADNITILDSSEQEKTVATKDLGSDIHASKVVLVDVTGDTYGYHDDEIALPVQVTEDIFHYAVHEGLAFTASAYHASEDIAITFTTPSEPTILHLLWRVVAEGNALFHVWEDSTIQSGGTEYVAYNKNRSSMGSPGTSGVKANTAGTTGSYYADVGNNGFDDSGTQINPTGFLCAKGTAIEADHEWVLKADTTYTFDCENIGNKDLGMTLTWFEVPVAT